MTGIPHNRPEVQLGIGRLLGIKGGFSQLLEQSINPTVNIADLVDTPYFTEFGVPVGETGSEIATAARFGVIAARPGPQMVLQIKQVILVNANGAAQDIAVRYCNAADLAALNGGVFTSTTQFTALAPKDPAGETRSSQLLVTNIAGGAAGDAFAQFTLAAGQSLVWQLPDPGLICYGGGTSPSSSPGLVVTGGIVNQIVRASVIGREWPKPG